MPQEAILAVFELRVWLQAHDGASKHMRINWELVPQTLYI